MVERGGEERGGRPGRSRAPAPALPPAAADARLNPLLAAAGALHLPLALVEAEAPAEGGGARILYANPAFAALAGFAEAELAGRALCTLLGHKGDASLDEALSGAATAPPGPQPECRLRRKDGTSFWAGLCITPVRDAEGRLVQHLVALHDVTAQRQEVDRLRLLLVELNHRTQNMFSAVLEMIRHSLRGKAPLGLVDTLTGRILAFSRAQNLLRDEMEGGITLRQVLDLVLQPPTIPRELAGRVVLEGGHVRLATNVALTIAMALHELAVNATRHGALSGDVGLVRIEWSVRPAPRGGQLALRWQEAGGPRMKPLYDKGFGMRLIEGGVQHGLGGTAKLNLEASGLVCDITLPLRQEGRNS